MGEPVLAQFPPLHCYPSLKLVPLALPQIEYTSPPEFKRTMTNGGLMKEKRKNYHGGHGAVVRDKPPNNKWWARSPSGVFRRPCSDAIVDREAIEQGEKATTILNDMIKEFLDWKKSMKEQGWRWDKASYNFFKIEGNTKIWNRTGYLLNTSFDNGMQTSPCVSLADEETERHSVFGEADD
ncbi:hypothetical protein PV08_06641 [Exophiala spinifera]|uniref:Uncharacterized protein n=1 Tax=Exophiala spinifera TaxID=91928 RepID=A0A0D1YFM0_9EURO|nr:uncharacterized protein PV08_06641 [Exophiala spinifera]KIW13861.1 hypothetical protein PV08_06641 [Exophiala spinifera]